MSCAVSPIRAAIRACYSRIDQSHFEEGVPSFCQPLSACASACLVPCRSVLAGGLRRVTGFAQPYRLTTAGLTSRASNRFALSLRLGMRGCLCRVREHDGGYRDEGISRSSSIGH
jgi:hypothetical protein